ncbi:cytochrome P450 76M5-like [Tasmannia lanceolata]|uniref:cytochrome P450 76M5-like n=1 Tax=Tasmannia lanceolata TaxID=3420 RepID=UPI0040648CAD
MAISDPFCRIFGSISKPKDEFTIAVFTFSVAVLVIAWYICLIIRKWREGGLELPPGPRGLPLVGNLLSIDSELHRYFAKLARTYGPIMSLRLGNRLCVVVSSSTVAKEILKDHDTIFANRDVPIAARVLSYGTQDIVWSAYGPHWRMLRKVCVRDLLNNTNLDAFKALRQHKVRQMVHNIYTKVGTPILVGEHIFETIFNTITSMLWGGTHESRESSTTSAEFLQVVKEVLILFNKPSISDIFPIVARFDIQGVSRHVRKLMMWHDRFFDRIIDQRLELGRTELKGNGQERKDFLQLLLHCKEQGEPLTTTDIKALFMDFVYAGNESTATTLEWAMAEMIDHPKAMRRAQEELDQVVGLSATVEEAHLSKLHYLSAAMKEVMRLHPAAPLLVPHCSSQSCVVGGYMVPKGAQVLVNAWAIQRDPEAWDKPLEFQPERFLMTSTKFDYSGNNLRYLPFGSGRRICVGMALAERLVMYTLASLLHSFDWRLPQGTKVDLSDKSGIILKMKTPLVAIPTPRLFKSALCLGTKLKAAPTPRLFKSELYAPTPRLFKSELYA